ARRTRLLGASCVERTASRRWGEWYTGPEVWVGEGIGALVAAARLCCTARAPFRTWTLCSRQDRTTRDVGRPGWFVLEVVSREWRARAAAAVRRLETPARAAATGGCAADAAAGG